MPEEKKEGHYFKDRKPAKPPKTTEKEAKPKK
jgi:hypothetical protein